ncbi:MAG: hypothetical protein ACYCW6_01955 [Candidatus Xenobia bacterium]
MPIRAARGYEPQSVSLVVNKNRPNRIIRSLAPREINPSRSVNNQLSANQNLNLSWEELL